MRVEKLIEKLVAQRNELDRDIRVMRKYMETPHMAARMERKWTKKTHRKPATKKRHMSVAARKRISDAQKTRWAKIHREQKAA